MLCPNEFPERRRAVQKRNASRTCLIREASLAQPCINSRIRAHTQTDTYPTVRSLCSCHPLTYLLSVGPSSSDNAQTPFLTANSHVLSLTGVCLRTASVGLHHDESMPWVCPPCILPPCVCQCATVITGHSGQGDEGWSFLAPHAFPLGCGNVAVLASLLCRGCLIHTSHLFTACQALLRHQPPFILFPLKKITPVMIGR